MSRTVLGDTVAKGPAGTKHLLGNEKNPKLGCASRGGHPSPLENSMYIFEEVKENLGKEEEGRGKGGWDEKEEEDEEGETEGWPGGFP